jgi:hypothetical protein
MGELLGSTVTAPAQQATSILRAWVLRDEVGLRRELYTGLHLPTSAGSLGFEDEMVDLLKAVLGRLDTNPDVLFADQNDPGVRLCMNLLLHLARSSDTHRFTPDYASSVQSSI